MILAMLGADASVLSAFDAAGSGDDVAGAPLSNAAGALPTVARLRRVAIAAGDGEALTTDGASAESVNHRE